MHLNSHYKIGLRAVKTAIAVFICALIDFILGTDNAFYSGIAAIVCIQQTYSETVSEGYHRLLGTLSGGIIGYIVLQTSRIIPWYNSAFNVVVIPLSVLFAIYFCNMINRKDAIPICCIVILSIIADPYRHVDDVLIYVLARVLNTSIGVLTAILVDKFIFPRKSEKTLNNKK